MQKIQCLFALLALTAPVVLSQTENSKHLSFDVVSIKRNHSGPGPAMGISPPDSDRIIIKNCTPRLIIGEAYGIQLHDLIIGLPPWADSETYDIEAKVAESDGPAFRKLLPMQRDPMLQPVLADRFHLKVHFKTRQLPAYVLVIANPKSGPKLTKVEPATLSNGLKDPGGIDTHRTAGQTEITATAAVILPLLHVLQLQLGRPVVDRTGLTGNYDFKLKWTPDPGASSTLANPDADAPSIFTAIQEQLGLKLEPVKAPIPVLVVDHIERPTEN